jgi:uncharacterized protein (UPF0264 family)
MPNPPSIATPVQPELLVSVRSIDEFDLVVAVKGVDIIDLKEPKQGALSPSSIELWQAVARRSRPQTLLSNDSSGGHITDQCGAAPCYFLSAALGEFDQADQRVGQLPAAFRFAKMGPSGCDRPDLLRRSWESIRQRLPKTTELVAVAYADCASAGVLPPMDVLRLAADSGMRRILIDTFTKDGRSSLDHLGIDGMREFAGAASQHGLWWSLAGSIGLPQIDQLATASIRPNCIGVRGAVCDGGRSQGLSARTCQELAQRLAG